MTDDEKRARWRRDNAEARAKRRARIIVAAMRLRVEQEIMQLRRAGLA